MGLGFIRRVFRRPAARNRGTRPAPRRRTAGTYAPVGSANVSAPSATFTGTGTLTAAFKQVHVMTATLTGTGRMSVDNGVVLVAVTIKAPQINPSAVTMRVP